MTDDRLPPLQIDPRLADTIGRHDDENGDDDDVIVVSPPGDGCPTIGFRLDEIVDSWLFNSTRVPSPTGVTCHDDDTQRHLADIGHHDDVISGLPFADDIDVDVDDAAAENPGLQCGGSLLAELLLGLAVYRGATPRDADRNDNITPATDNVSKRSDDGDHITSGFDFAHEREPAESAGTSIVSTCTPDGAQDYNRKLSCGSDSFRVATALKRTHNGDVIKSFDESNNNKLLKLGTSCGDAVVTSCDSACASENDVTSHTRKSNTLGLEL